MGLHSIHNTRVPNEITCWYYWLKADKFAGLQTFLFDSIHRQQEILFIAIQIFCHRVHRVELGTNWLVSAAS
ncbi:hypothetical protein SUGI_0104010 [Cryptomeria japonica]|nr:hypothetical protein SUGI_0104010 [Cryptomeria japonica]